MKYAEKLIVFNATKKYRKELRELRKLLGSSVRGPILDYGCGNGTAVSYLRQRGYDVKGYDPIKHNPSFEYSEATGRWEAVYFMHSIAHIPAIVEVLKVLDTPKIVIITPNRDWLSLQSDKNYIPDPTVLEHYNQIEITNLLNSAGFDFVTSYQFGRKANGQKERIAVVAKRV